MKRGKSFYILPSIVLCIAGVGAVCLTLRNPQPVHAMAAQEAVPAANGSTKSVDPRDVNPSDVPNKVANFLGNLTAGATPEAAGRERNYIVSYQVDFLRQQPGKKTTEEDMTYEQLQAGNPEVSAPYVFYGETVSGKYDPAQPGVIAIHATIDGKEVSGYVDAAKLWLEPPLDGPRSERYMAVGAVVAVHVLPSLTSPPAQTLLQGEVVDAVGVLSSQGQDWVKARFNVPDRPRYGFIAANELQPLTLASVDQSKVALKEVPARIRDSELKFSAADQKRLSQIGFYIEPMPPLKDLTVDDLADSYQDISPGEQYFITTDLFLHAYHLIFDRMLQDMEEKRLLPAAKKLSVALAKTTDSELKAAPATATAYHDALRRDLLYFSVAAKVLDPAFTLPTEVRPQAETIVARINAGTGELPSTQNFLGFEKEDFTQYKVRGHYAKNAAMQRYFRGMMWYGRRNFLLSDKAQTLAAILLPHLVDAANADNQFNTIDRQVSSLIGEQDRYTLYGYRTVNKKVFGVEAPALKVLGANPDAKLAAFQETAWKDLPQPRIVTVQTRLGLTPDQRLRESAGMQFLGQRFVLDALFLNQLSSPSVGTDQNPRNLPSALDIMTVLGSSAAADLQQAAQKEHQWANYDAQMAKLKQQVDTPYALNGGYYAQCLARLRTLFLSTGSKQMFLVGDPWQYKSLNAAGASWTELKHDTLLYAEQSAAEMGGGDEFKIPPYVPPPPKGYVEPNPAFFHQLTGSIDEMLLSMNGPDGLTDEYADKFTLFRELAHRAEAIAQEEVFGQPISPGDYDWIQTLRSNFDRSLLLPRGSDEIKDPSQLRMALVADVATDGVDGLVLEEGVGTPQRITVVVKDAFGGTRLTVGYVYSWYEFPSKKRWNDAEWKKAIYDGSAKTRKEEGITPPAWYSEFLKSDGKTP